MLSEALTQNPACRQIPSVRRTSSRSHPIAKLRRHSFTSPEMALWKTAPKACGPEASILKKRGKSNLPTMHEHPSLAQGVTVLRCLVHTWRGCCVQLPARWAPRTPSLLAAHQPAVACLAFSGLGDSFLGYRPLSQLPPAEAHVAFR